MEQTILRAKVILADKFNIESEHFEKNYSRKKSVVEARRFLVYFLRTEFEYTYYEIIKFVPAFKTHASALHHFNNMEYLLEIEKPLKQMYKRFYDDVMGSNKQWIEQEIGDLTNGRKLINKQITKLKRLL